MKSITLPILLTLTSLAAARTDLDGCTKSATVNQWGEASMIWYVPDTGEICDFPDCGGGRAPPKLNQPGCAAYTGTETLTPSYLPGWGPNGKYSDYCGTYLSTQVSSSAAGSSSRAGGSSRPASSAAGSSSRAGGSSSSASSGAGGSSSTASSVAVKPTGNAASMPGLNAGVLAVAGVLAGIVAL
ncbi:siderophore biosynthesis enzyme [Aspergillus nomiae NRRL 13137]|uniref:Siderophore biosynthesis enzyme n=1 Tax=Aspergillus nomiae NRRL (strain ATCC 15546 / NRRL 13137 / CBS 260.88 / M93) TaxID=1509407 RepID=A0A0L1ITY6_ASPN3|nr:siderophore biosynthesis enzyme [Aspergillus nomiae NRRL 13137]KNG82947.1 siderophore biosynthesis enzyme [Aspergillus nomiae NRRL 13137]